MESAKLTRSEDPEYEAWGLVDSIEHSFGVHFWPRELNAATTVQALHDIMVDKLGKQGAEKCLCAATFYHLRRAMVEFCGVSRSAVTPCAHLRDLLPIRKRRYHWDLLSSVINREMPPLKYPKGVVAVVTLLTFAITWALTRFLTTDRAYDMGPLFKPRYIHYSYGYGWEIWLAALLFGFCILSLLLTLVLQPLAVSIPAGCETVGEYVKTAVDSISVRRQKLWADGTKESSWTVCDWCSPTEWGVRSIKFDPKRLSQRKLHRSDHQAL